jgi:hypothetical protein
VKEKRGTDARDRIIEPKLIPFRGCCRVNRMKVHVEQASAKFRFSLSFPRRVDLPTQQ